jgi:hypothetical protein
MLIPKVSLTRLLIPRAAVARIKRNNRLALCISHMLSLFQKSSNVCRIVIALGPSSELNIFLVVHSRKAGRKEIRNRRYIFPVTMAEATLAKQADLQPCGSANIDTVSKRVF